ncbi:TRM11 family SAM-dependent methyltransferase [Kribbella amoyensis]|uniref:TRM11 family SAM-dependent methyltransferase n=1 Tax=Kribbella amoyensis TaxID=996641 RepID=UPI001478A2FB|nr:methyltransferase domain-containing protein [Kribbella amoyensis]
MEQLAAEELAAAQHRVIDLSRRQLVIEPHDATVVTSPPRLADDLFLIHDAVPDPGHTRQALADAVPAIQLTGEPADFAVTASFQGRRNFNRYDIEDLVGERLRELTGGRYHSRREGVTPPVDRVDWRVVLDGKTLWVGRRPFAVPLHRREWRRHTVTGSLHPPVAAAIARLGRLAPGLQVLDPFCGAGTLLLEAHAVEPGATYRGIDRQPAAIAAARANTPYGAEIAWQEGDARQVRGSVDRILTNPPWDVRLGIGPLGPYLRQWRRVLRPDGLLVAIVNHEQAERIGGDAAWQILDEYDVAVAGQHPRILVAGLRQRGVTKVR